MFWHSKGYIVIPTITWSCKRSHKFCFLGAPKRSVVAIGTVGLDWHTPSVRHHFMSGFNAMLEHLEPTLILCYGKAPPVCHSRANIREYPTHWTNINNARKRKNPRKPASSASSAFHPSEVT